MIDWLYQSTLDISVLIVLILLIRNPVRRLLGAHVSYWLWSLPLLRLIFSNKFERPKVITKYLSAPESNDLIPVYSSPINSSETQIEMLTLVWLIGLFIWSVYKLIQSIKFKSLLQKFSTYIPTDQVLTDSLAAKYKTNIQFNSSDAIEGPLITGLLKPKVYLPYNFFDIYNKKQRQHIIEHELTHAKRKDLWAQLIAEIFKTVFWFNPLVHLAYTKFQEDQELACDHQVLKNANKQTRLEYGETLSIGLSALLTPNSLTFFSHKHERFIMLTKHKNNLFISIAGLMIIVVIAYVMMTKETVSFDYKQIETHGSLISYEFKNIPLDSIVMLVSDASGGIRELQQIEILQGILITAKAQEVYAFDFLDALLKEQGFRVNRQGNTWYFSRI